MNLSFRKYIHLGKSIVISIPKSFVIQHGIKATNSIVCFQARDFILYSPSDCNTETADKIIEFINSFEQ